MWDMICVCPQHVSPCLAPLPLPLLNQGERAQPQDNGSESACTRTLSLRMHSYALALARHWVPVPSTMRNPQSAIRARTDYHGLADRGVRSRMSRLLVITVRVCVDVYKTNVIMHSCIHSYMYFDMCVGVMS